MVTIDNYSFIYIEKNKMKLASQNDMNDPKRKIVIVGTICSSEQDKVVKIIEVKKYEKTYIIGSFNSYNSLYYLGRKSKEMKTFEKMLKENISVVTNFRIGYAYNPKNNWKHIPCIIGKVEHEKAEKVIFVESQNFKDNTITDINGKVYFLDWLSMNPYQYKNFVLELNNFPMNLKKHFGVFCEKGLKIDMISLNDSLPILGIAGAFEIK